MTNEMLFLILLAVLIVGALPAWPYSQSWGYAPTGILTAVLIVVVLWAVMGRDARTPAENLKSDLQSTGQDLKEMGREAADSIRKTVE